jgi:hypothetical protein
MKKCIHCGAELNDDAAFCGICGKSVNDTANKFVPVAPPKSKANVNLIVAIIVLGVIFIMILSYIFGDTEDENTPTSNADVAQTDVLDETQTNTPTPTKTPKPTPTPEQTPTPDMIKANCGYVKYSDLARNPEEYKDKYLTYKGKVIQSSESSTSKRRSYTIRLAVDSNYDSIVYVKYTTAPDAPRILENDIVHIYGKADGLTSYTTVLGQKITIPKIEADLIE